MKQRFLAAIAIFAVAGCDLSGVRGNGHIVTEQRQVAPFKHVEASGAFQIDWRSGPVAASVTADENLLGMIELRVRDDVLRLRTTQQVRPTRSIKVTLASPSLEGARLSGACRLYAHELRGRQFALETSGAAKVNLAGNVDELIASMTGASDLRAESLPVKKAALAVTGAGDAYVNVSDTLQASITGAGKVEYTGNPPHIERRITGAGSIRKRD